IEDAHPVMGMGASAAIGGPDRVRWANAGRSDGAAARAARTGQEAHDQHHDDRADDGHDDRAEGERALDRVLDAEDRAGQEAADDGADDPEDDVADDAQPLVALDEQAGEIPGDGTENNPGEDVHTTPIDDAGADCSSPTRTASPVPWSRRRNE